MEMMEGEGRREGPAAVQGTTVAAVAAGGGKTVLDEAAWAAARVDATAATATRTTSLGSTPAYHPLPSTSNPHGRHVPPPAVSAPPAPQSIPHQRPRNDP